MTYISDAGRITFLPRVFPYGEIRERSCFFYGTRKETENELTVTGKLGTMGCHRGHHIGETFDYDSDRGKICPMAMHCAFPYIDILRYGGKLPGQPAGEAEFCCSDADVALVFKAKVIE